MSFKKPKYLNSKSSKSSNIVLLVITVFFFLVSCIQGPWDYYPKNPETHRGLWVTGYVIGGQPIKHFCIEKMLKLNEEYTNAFVFYKSATVEITGDFNGQKTISLSPDSSQANCFLGDPTAIATAGQPYELNARIDWDSLGVPVTTQITATAQVPDFFELSDTAKAPSQVLTGPNLQNSGQKRGLQTLLNELSKEAREAVINAYGETTLLSIAADSARQDSFFVAEGKNILKIVEDYNITYNNGDTVFYLVGAFNTALHNFNSRYSKNVGGVLITQVWDSTAGSPISLFAEMIKKPDTADLHLPGNSARLMHYWNYVSNNGVNFLNNMGVVNSWFFTGLNTLYFYGMEKSYINFLETAVREENNSKVKPKYNITGAAGIFAGGLVDSFFVHIKTDEQTEVYSLWDARAADCKNKGWEVHEGCRSFYPEYCDSIAWEDKNCTVDLIQQSLEGNQTISLDSLQKKWAYDSTSFSQTQKKAETRYCIQNNFPTTGFNCTKIQDECNGSKRQYEGKLALWQYCLDRKWTPSQCNLGLVSYCLDKPRLSEVLCQHADSYCTANTGETLCMEASQKK